MALIFEDGNYLNRPPREADLFDRSSLVTRTYAVPFAKRDPNFGVLLKVRKGDLLFRELEL